MFISLFAVVVNVGLKLVLFKPYGVAGLAMATAVGAWLNFLLLAGFAFRRGTMKPTLSLGQTVACVSLASFGLSVFAIYASDWSAPMAAKIGHFGNELSLMVIGAGGGLVYLLILGIGFAAYGMLPLRRAKG